MLDAIPQSRRRHSGRYRQETTKGRKWTKKCSVQGKSGREDTDQRGREADRLEPDCPNDPFKGALRQDVITGKALYPERPALVSVTRFSTHVLVCLWAHTALSSFSFAFSNL